MTNSTKEHELSASNSLDEEDSGPRSDEVLGTVECREKTRHEWGHAEVRVDLGGIVGDEIDTRNLLEHLVDVGDDCTVESAVVVGMEQLAVSTLAHLHGSILDGLEFIVDLLVSNVNVCNGSDNFSSLIFATLENEPSRRLRQAKDKGKNEDAEDNLEGQGESPSNRTGGKRQAKIDPIRNHDAARDEGTFNHDEFSSLVGGTRLRLPHGYRRCVTAIAKACYDTTDDKVFQSESRSLQDSANNHDGSTEKDHFPTAEVVTDEDGDDGADEASQIVRCHSNTLVSRALGRIRGIRSKIWIDVGELGKEDGQRQDTSHDTLICELLDNSYNCL